MFGKKKKEIQELKRRLQNLLLKPSQFNDSLQYLDEVATLYRNEITNCQALLYIQKIICNSIIYDNYAYAVLRNPNTAPNLELTDFLPITENHRFSVKDLNPSPIYLPGSITPFLTV